MRILIAEDDFVGRKFLAKALTKFGDCDIVVNGVEALSAFNMALEEQNPYSIVCLDIMMPELDGQNVLKEIRKIEKEREIMSFEGVKVIMVTALKDLDNIRSAFREQVDSYLVKPIEVSKLEEEIRNLKINDK